MMCMAAVTFSACSDDDDDDKSINVPESVVQALKQKYPSATGIEWEQKGTYFVADCWLDGKESNIWFDPNANWLMTESEIFWNDLPEAVQTAFGSGEYANWVQDDYYFLLYPLQPMQYVIEVKHRPCAAIPNGTGGKTGKSEVSVILLGRWRTDEYGECDREG